MALIFVCYVDNFYRVRLKSSAVPGSDYINASFIHVKEGSTYITTWISLRFFFRVTDRRKRTLLPKGRLSQQSVIFGEWCGRTKANVLCS